MELLIGINLDNAAFHDEIDDRDRPAEDEGEAHLLNARGVAFCLTKVIDSLDGIVWTEYQEQTVREGTPLYAGPIVDENGNTVGRWAIAPEPADEDLKAQPSRHG